MTDDNPLTRGRRLRTRSSTTATRWSRASARGGMADVYCAEDSQLGRRVALKVLHRRFAEDQEFVERFRREASAAAGLQHPNVVQVFDRGELEGTYYIAMEFLEGRSLKQLVRDEGPLEPARAIDITIQVLRAARFAHKRGIIHRDFKPHNVIVDDEGRVKVTDFGIARAGASDMTETGRDHGHRRLPVARAGAGPRGVGVQRPVLDRDPALRAAHAAARRSTPSRPCRSRSSRSREAPVPPRVAQPGGVARARGRRAARAAEGPRAPLRRRRRVRRRARGRARAAGPPGRRRSARATSPASTRRWLHARGRAARRRGWRFWLHGAARRAAPWRRSASAPTCSCARTR